MKKIISLGIAGFVVVAIAGVVAFRTIAAKEPAGPTVSTDASPKLAKELQRKIDAIKDSEDNPKHKRGSMRIVVSDVELESYLLYSLKDDIPAQVDIAKVQLDRDTVSLD